MTTKTTRPLKELKGNQFEILRFIYNFKYALRGAHDYSPSYEEISNAVPARRGQPMSKSVLAYHLGILKSRYGYINFVPRQSRTVHCTAAGKAFIQAHLLPERITSMRAKIKHE